MAKISINLLPPEIIQKEIKKANFYKIQIAGIAVILIMIFLASLTAALRILQSNNITSAEEQLTQTQERVTELKGTQDSLFLLKDRLSIINKYLGVSSNQSALYRLLEQLIPPDVSINSININKAGDILLLVTVPDSLNLETLVNNLSISDNNEGRITQVSLESLSRGRDGYYRVSLKIKYKV